MTLSLSLQLCTLIRNPDLEIAHFVATLSVSGGSTYTFDSAAAVDQGDYVGAFVSQKSLMVQLSGCPYTVFFRPDRNGARDEVVVELGKIRSGTPAHSPSYTFSVTKNGSPLFNTTVARHWWWSRWRWQSAPRPFVRTAAQLITNRQVPKLTTSYLAGYSAWSNNYTYTNPMDIANLQSAQGTGGDRPELGIITMPQADYLLLSTTLAKSSMIAQAEACASISWHVRDEATGAPFDVQVNPYWGTFSGFPPIIPTAAAPTDSDYTLIDVGHNPTLCYVPYLLTDDPYYLEELQFTALYHIIFSNFHSSNQALPGLAYPGESRHWYWGVRDIGYAAAVTPPSVPNWLNSQNYWQQCLADNRTYLQRFMDSPARVHQVFHAMPFAGFFLAFQSDYGGITLAQMARLFPTQWTDGYQWFMAGVIPVVSDGLGWKKGWPIPYYLYPFISDTWGVGRSVNLVPDNSLDSDTYPSWAALFGAFCTNQGDIHDPTLVSCPNPPWDGTTIVQQQASRMSYLFWRSANLHLAVGLSVTGAATASTWLDSQIPAIQTADGGVNDPRFSFDTT